MGSGSDILCAAHGREAVRPVSFRVPSLGKALMPAHTIYCHTRRFNMKWLIGAHDHPLLLVRPLLGSGRLLKQPVTRLRA